jgi:hypothetical protein
MFKILLLLNLFSFSKADTIFTDYARMCDFNKKTKLSNCDEMMLNSSFIFPDSTEYIYQSISHFQGDAKSEKSVDDDFYNKYSIDTCFTDSVSKKYIFNTSYGKYMFIRYFSVPMIKVYFFDDKEGKVTQTIYFSTKFFKE